MKLRSVSEFSLYNSPVFTISRLYDKPDSIHMIMRLKGHVVNTKDLPETLKILNNYCPSVLSTECFNEKHLPFREEVKRTEIGHLFEHLLLVNVCIEKVKQGVSKYCIEGKTSWNWKKETWGTFHIYIPQMNDLDKVFRPAFNDAVTITERVMHN